MSSALQGFGTMHGTESNGGEHGWGHSKETARVKKIAITACTLDCPDTCSLLILEDAWGKPRVAGNRGHPFTGGFTCRKSRRFFESLQSPSRIAEPLLRRGDAWESIGWGRAPDLCAEKIQELRNSLRPYSTSTEKLPRESCSRRRSSSSGSGSSEVRCLSVTQRDAWPAWLILVPGKTMTSRTCSMHAAS